MPDAVSARDLLGPASPLSRGLAGYEDRPGQLDMADAVERALRDERVLVCEAGTGTGKTLAYLVPAILSGKKVVVSTATKALQEQIFTRDLPLIERELGLDAQAVVVKGLSNYLCLRRFGEFRRSPEALEPRNGRALGIIERFRERTQTGDFADIPDFGEDAPILQEVRSSSETRIGSACDFYDECFVTRMKRAAERARILIVNHHLFFADLALKGPHTGGALPNYDAVIFDEAHQLEDVATSFFGIRISSARIESILRDAERAFVEAGLIDALLRKGEAAVIITLAREAAGHLFAELAQHHSPTEGRAPLSAGIWKGELLTRYHKVDTVLEALAAYAASHEKGEAIELLSRRAQQLRQDFSAVVEGSHNQVTWTEVRSRSISIGASPVDLSQTLRSRIFEQLPSVVLTSATLATSQGFSFLRSRLGIGGDTIAVDEAVVPSPFDYPSRALVYVPDDLPDPRDATFSERAGARAFELVEMTGGGAFILCTSNRVMHAIHRQLALRPRGSLGPLLLQGETSKAMLLAKFREAENAVLVATMSFWEGVDVPGRALRLVILDKIPFAVPTDPVVVARSRALEEAGESPFLRYHVPAAAISLKQGFGRLIRTRKDAGVVAVLDRRLHARGYGKVLLESLPPAGRTSRIEDVKAFVDRLALAPLPSV